MWGWVSGTKAEPEIPLEQRIFWYEYLTPEQTKTVADLRAQLKTLSPSNTSDRDLARFLVARKWQVADAQAMYEAMTRWRHEFGADSLLGSFRFPQYEQVATVYPTFFWGTDRFGRPVYVKCPGRGNFAALLELADRDTVLKFHVWTWEYLRKHRFPAASIAAGKTIDSMLTLIDFGGVTMTQFGHVQSLMQSISVIDQDNYPEHLGDMFILNAGFAFKAIWACISPFLDARTQSKIRLLSGLADDQVFSLLPRESLPVFLGGTKEVTLEECLRQDPGPWGEEKVLEQLYTEGRGCRDGELAFCPYPYLK